MQPIPSFLPWPQARRHLALAGLTLALLPAAAQASVFGTLGNFDVINDTGSTAHGFEIELEGLHLGDISDVFGGYGRGFPTGTGFDPGTAVERYGAPSVAEYADALGTVLGVRITYAATYAAGSWDFGTPSGSFVTPGDNCWTGGGLGYGPATPCDHFGVGLRANATATRYSWLVESAATPAQLVRGAVLLPAPVWAINPPAPANPAAAPVVVARVEAPEPAPAAEFGEALWAKVFTTELDNEPRLEDLVAGNPVIDGAETEIEWQLLQKDFKNPAAGVLENAGAANKPNIIRRYEFYAFGGLYDTETHEALFDTANGFGDSNPGPGDVGNYLGAQNAALMLAPIPEPASLGLMLAGLALLGAWVRRQRRQD